VGLPEILIGLAGVVAIYSVAVLALALAGRRSAARALAGFVPDCAVLFRRLLADPDTSRWERVALAALVAYLVSPIDLVPDFVPVAGQLDDAAIVALALAVLLRRRGEGAIRAAWPGPESSLRIVLGAAARAPGAGRPATKASPGRGPTL
jgi:uncharacterized membrane protein YkvA (DUF1232 family)